MPVLVGANSALTTLTAVAVSPAVDYFVIRIVPVNVKHRLVAAQQLV
jgi:hypothetical protein